MLSTVQIVVQVSSEEIFDCFSFVYNAVIAGRMRDVKWKFVNPSDEAETEPLVP